MEPQPCTRTKSKNEQNSHGSRHQPSAAPRSGRACSLHPLRLHAVGSNGPSDVLKPLLAGRPEPQVELALELIIGCARNEHASWFAQSLQAGGDVNAVTQEILALDHDITEVYADAKDDPPLGRHLFLLLGHSLLHSDRAGDRIHH